MESNLGRIARSCVGERSHRHRIGSRLNHLSHTDKQETTGLAHGFRRSSQDVPHILDLHACLGLQYARHILLSLPSTFRSIEANSDVIIVSSPMITAHCTPSLCACAAWTIVRLKADQCMICNLIRSSFQHNFVTLDWHNIDLPEYCKGSISGRWAPIGSLVHVPWWAVTASKLLRADRLV